MAERLPLVIIDGQVQELPSGDSIPGAGGSASYPDFTSNAGKVLAVNATEDDVEWVEPSGLISLPYDIRFGFSTTPSSEQILETIPLPRAITLPANLVGTVGLCGTNPTSSFTMSLQVNGVQQGTIVVATDGSFSFTTTAGAAISISAGDTLTVVAPTATDATVENVVVTILGDLA